jgi:hypothetical protein
MKNADYPSDDGVYKGRLYECGVCGQSARKYDMRKQRGLWVHKDPTRGCYDAKSFKEK